MNKQNYILTKKANGDTRTVAVIGGEFDKLIKDMAPKPKATDIVGEHIVPQLNIAEQTRADGKQRTGVFKDDGTIKWGTWKASK